METLASSAKYLAEHDIEVAQESATRLRCSRRNDRSLTLTHESGVYVLNCWDRVPGPGIEDFHAECASWDDALLAVWYFYFGAPIVLNGWKVSMNRQPSWTLSKVAYRIANAPRVSAEQFDLIASNRKANLMDWVKMDEAREHVVGRYSVAMRSQFIPCPASGESSSVMMLRRDLEEAYLVEALA